MTLPVDLLNVFEAAKAEPKDSNLYLLWTKLTTGNFHLTSSDSVEARVELANIWLATSLMILQHNNESAITNAEMDAMATLLACPESIAHVIRNEDSARMLAFICAASTAERENGARYSFSKGIVKLLSIWTGATLDNDDEPSFEEVINLLHGPMTYSLYRPEVVTDAQLPSHLYRQCVPVLRRPHLDKGCEHVVMVDMPDDLLASGQP